MNIENKTKTYNSNGKHIYSCQYHIIFCPKYRRKILINPIDERLKEILNNVSENLNAEIIEMEVMPDHVHILISTDINYSISYLVKRLKGTSSGLLRKEFPQLKKKLPSLWTRSFFVSSVGSVSLDIVKKYIEEQKNI
jgi:putative transposase